MEHINTCIKFKACGAKTPFIRRCEPDKLFRGRWEKGKGKKKRKERQWGELDEGDKLMITSSNFWNLIGVHEICIRLHRKKESRVGQIKFWINKLIFLFLYSWIYCYITSSWWQRRYPPHTSRNNPVFRCLPKFLFPLRFQHTNTNL